MLPEDPKKEFPVIEKETKPLFSDLTEVGWLVVHDKKKRQQTLPLQIGTQIIGRISSLADKKADLMIDTEDEYISRQQFTINVERNDLHGYSYYLSDNTGKNRTLINKKVLKKGDEYILKDGDIIQAGLTIIVFKSNKQVKDRIQETQSIVNQPKVNTDLVFYF